MKVYEFLSEETSTKGSGCATSGQRRLAWPGSPPGVLQMLPGGADVGEVLVTDPSIGVVSFADSTAVGRRIGELAGKHLNRAHLELGGNSAMLVLDDTDVDAAVNLAAWGSFFHQGQICMTTGRHLVADADPDRHRAHQRPDRERRGERAVRRCRLGHRRPVRWRAAADVEAFTETRWITMPGEPAQYPF
jgi:Aldehyde dehydrogenase family